MGDSSWQPARGLGWPQLTLPDCLFGSASLRQHKWCLHQEASYVSKAESEVRRELRDDPFLIRKERARRCSGRPMNLGLFCPHWCRMEMLPEEVREAARLQLGAAFLTPSPAALLRKGGTVT